MEKIVEKKGINEWIEFAHTHTHKKNNKNVQKNVRRDSFNLIRNRGRP